MTQTLNNIKKNDNNGINLCLILFKFIICLSISITLFLLIYFLLFKIQTVQIMLTGNHEITNKPFIRSLNKAAFTLEKDLGASNLKRLNILKKR